MASVMTRAIAMSTADSLASSSCSMSCSCSVWPCWSLKSLLRSSSPDQGVSDGPLVCSPQASSAISTSGSSRCSAGVLLPSSSAYFSSTGRSSRSRGSSRSTASPRDSGASSSASSITLVSSVSRTCACRSSEGSCSSLMACCNCGVMVSCWPMRSCRLGFNIVLSDPRLQFEILAQVHLTNLRIGKNLIRRSGGEHRPLTDDVRSAANPQGFPDIMIGYEHANALVGQVLDYSLNIDDGQRVDTGEWFVQQDEPWVCRQSAGDLHPAALAARKTHPEAVADMADMQLSQELLEARRAPPFVEPRPRFQNRHDVIRHREAAEHRGFLREITQAQLRPPVQGY